MALNLVSVQVRNESRSVFIQRFGLRRSTVGKCVVMVDKPNPYPTPPTPNNLTHPNHYLEVCHKDFTEHVVNEYGELEAQCHMITRELAGDKRRASRVSRFKHMIKKPSTHSTAS